MFLISLQRKLVDTYNAKSSEPNIIMEYIGRNKDTLTLRIKVPVFDLLKKFNDYSASEINLGFKGVEAMCKFVHTYSKELKNLL